MWSVIGKLAVAYVLSKLLISLLRGVYSTYIAHMFRLNLNLSKTGKWAVVTGATDGIGKAYVFELAARGLNIVLISRTAAKLQAVAEEIKEKYPVEVKTIAANFFQTDIYENIAKELKGMDIGVLVNNVGMSYDHPEILIDVPNVEEFCMQLVNINIMSVNRMTLIVLPGMQERRRGIIINVSSLSCISPTPLLTFYAASKAYVQNFSKNLQLEVASKGVTIQCVVPGFVVSNLSKMRRTTWMTPNPSTFVKQAISTVGVEQQTGGYIVHKLIIYAIELQGLLFPSFLFNNHMLGTMMTMRKLAIKKKEREAKSN